MYFVQMKYVVLIIFLFNFNCYANDLKVNLNYGLTDYSEFADFQYLEDYPGCCPGFEMGKSVSNQIYFDVTYELYNNFNLGLGLNFGVIDGQLSYYENTILNFNGFQFDGEIKHEFDFRNTILSPKLFTSYKYNIIEVFVGLEYQYFSEIDVKGREVLYEPKDIGYFVDSSGFRSRTRNQWNGSIQNPNTLFFVFGGIRAEIALNKKGTFNLTPSIFYNYSLGEIFNDSDWYRRGTSFSLGLNYYINRDKENIKIPEKIIDPDIFFTYKLDSKEQKELVVDEKSIHLKSFLIDEETLQLTDTNFTSKLFSSDTITFLFDVGSINRIRNLDLIKNGKKIKDLKSIRDKVEFNFNEIFESENNLDFQLLIKTEKELIYSRNLELSVNHKENKSIQESRLYLIKRSLKIFEAELIEIPEGKSLTIYSDNAVIAGRLSRTIDNSNLSVNIVDKIPAEIPKAFYEDQNSYSFVYLVFE